MTTALCASLKLTLDRQRRLYAKFPNLSNISRVSLTFIQSVRILGWYFTNNGHIKSTDDTMKRPFCFVMFYLCSVLLNNMELVPK